MPEVVGRTETASPPGFELFEKSEIERSIGERFEKMARRHCEREAIRTLDGGGWTYARLNAAANRVARALAPAAAGRPVAILLPPDAPLFAAMLGTLKAGRFYAALDAALAAERLQDVSERSRPRPSSPTTRGSRPRSRWPLRARGFSGSRTSSTGEKFRIRTAARGPTTRRSCSSRPARRGRRRASCRAIATSCTTS